jgi:hypothetical protein
VKKARVLIACAVLLIVVIAFAAPKARLVLDQSNFVQDGLGINGFMGQTFMPKAKNVAQVDLRFIVNQIPPEGVDIEIGIYTDITEEPIATTTTHVAPPGIGELERTVSFQFIPPVLLRKGMTYTIGCNDDLHLAAWTFGFNDPYPLGQAVLYDGTALNPPADFYFATYELKSSK